MRQPFLEREVKTLLIQLLRGVHCLHDNWLLHRKHFPLSLSLFKSFFQATLKLPIFYSRTRAC